MQRERQRPAGYRDLTRDAYHALTSFSFDPRSVGIKSIPFDLQQPEHR